MQPLERLFPFNEFIFTILVLRVFISASFQKFAEIIEHISYIIYALELRGPKQKVMCAEITQDGSMIEHSVVRLKFTYLSLFADNGFCLQAKIFACRQQHNAFACEGFLLSDGVNYLLRTSWAILDSYDWKSFDEERCFGVSTSLYERNPLTGVNAGNPIADVFGIVARDNNVIMALADGVNWGEGARLAARCAIRGAIDHLNYHLFADPCKTTTVSYSC